MAARRVDYEMLRTVAKTLDEAAACVDEAGMDMPDEVDAGPLAGQVAVLGTVAMLNGIELIVRTRIAAEMVRVALANYAFNEYEAAHESRNIGRELEEG